MRVSQPHEPSWRQWKGVPPGTAESIGNMLKSSERAETLKLLVEIRSLPSLLRAALVQRCATDWERSSKIHFRAVRPARSADFTFADISSALFRGGAFQGADRGGQLAKLPVWNPHSLSPDRRDQLAREMSQLPLCGGELLDHFANPARLSAVLSAQDSQGHSVLFHLARLQTAALDPQLTEANSGVAASIIAENLRDHLIENLCDPNWIGSVFPGSQSPLAQERRWAESAPAEYARMVSDLAVSGSTLLPTGQRVRLASDFLDLSQRLRLSQLGRKDPSSTTEDVQSANGCSVLLEAAIQYGGAWPLAKKSGPTAPIGSTTSEALWVLFSNGRVRIESSNRHLSPELCEDLASVTEEAIESSRGLHRWQSLQNLSGEMVIRLVPNEAYSKLTGLDAASSGGATTSAHIIYLNTAKLGEKRWASNAVEGAVSLQGDLELTAVAHEVVHAEECQESEPGFFGPPHFVREASAQLLAARFANTPPTANEAALCVEIDPHLARTALLQMTSSVPLRLPGEANNLRMDVDYAVAQLFFEYVGAHLPAGGPPIGVRLGQFYESLGQGTPWKRAFATAFGQSIDGLQDDFFRHLAVTRENPEERLKGMPYATTWQALTPHHRKEAQLAAEGQFNQYLSESILQPALQDRAVPAEENALAILPFAFLLAAGALRKRSLRPIPS